jgi:hypothetical protein
MHYEIILAVVLTGLGCANAAETPPASAALALAPEPVLPRGYVAYRAATPIVIDGRLDEPAWQAAPWWEDHADIEGFQKTKPRFRTRGKMLWDDKYFYIAAFLEEPHVWGTLTQHDAVIFQDNDFEVFIDPDGDNQQYYEIEINALNTEWDLRLAKAYRNGGPALNEWEIPGLLHATHVEGTLNQPGDTDRGWSIEFAFPWESLREYAGCACPPRDGDQWRVNFSRVEWVIDIIDGKYRKIAGRPEDNWIWSPQGFVDMHRPETWGFVQFSKVAAGGDTVRFQRDPDYPARMYLMKVYFAQAEFRGKNQRWAGSVAELGLAGNGGGGTERSATNQRLEAMGLAPKEDARFAGSARIELVGTGYKASVDSTRGGRLCLREDSRLWREEGEK